MENPPKNTVAVSTRNQIGKLEGAIWVVLFWNFGCKKMRYPKPPCLGSGFLENRLRRERIQRYRQALTAQGVPPSQLFSRALDSV